MRTICTRTVAATLAAIAVSQAASFAQEKAVAIQPFPGGATAITETHGDWTVFCEAKAEGRSCTAMQTLGTKESRQAIMTMEVVGRSQGTANALLTLPFGLDLRKGVSLQFDDGAPATIPFSACVEQGCLVSIDFELQDLGQLRQGKVIHLSAQPSDTDKPLELTISLVGFRSAFDRSMKLVE